MLPFHREHSWRREGEVGCTVKNEVPRGRAHFVGMTCGLKVGTGSVLNRRKETLLFSETSKQGEGAGWGLQIAKRAVQSLASLCL